MKKILFLITLVISSSFAMEGKKMIVYKSPSCACCDNWINIMKKNGFNVETVMSNNVNYIKQRVGLTPQTASCHTAIVDGYFVEGHVNYSAVKKMLTQKPEIKGITVPGMPIGSPGMEQGDIKQPYDVLSVDLNGKTKVYESHRN